MLRVLILLLLIAGSAQAQDAGALRARHAAVQGQLADNPFGRPLHVESSASGGAHKGEIYAVIEQPYSVVALALARPDASCRSVQITRAALRQHGAGDPTVNMSGATGGSPESERPAILSTCPICHEPATVVRGIADAAWYAVDGCACAGYVVAADALEWRLSRLTAAERAELVATLQGFRAMGRDAWLSTGDGSISGRLVIRTQSPRRSS